MRVSAIVVNYNAGQELLHCVESLGRHLTLGQERDEIVVIDNRSSDGSLEAVQALPEVVSICSRENGGYGTACNIGASVARGSLLLFLNPDASLATDLTPALKLFASDARCAVVSPRIVDGSGSDYETLGPLPTVLSDFLNETNLNRWFVKRRWKVATLRRDLGPFRYQGLFSSGSAILVRRSLFEEVGRFDSGFFLYYEETDLFKRLAFLDTSFYFCPEIEVRHIEGGSSGSLGWKRTALRYASKARYFAKHEEATGLLVHRLTMLVVLIVKLISQFVVNPRSNKLHAHVFGLRLYGRPWRHWRAQILAAVPRLPD